MEDPPKKSILELFPPEEFEMTVVELPDGGAEYIFDITGRTREYLERIAKIEGKTVGELIKDRALPGKED